MKSGPGTGPQNLIIMTAEELQSKMESIARTAALEKKKAYFEYVRTNAKFKIGDVIHDSTTVIRVTSIKFRIWGSSYIPDIYYEGQQLTKKGEPRKDGATACVDEKRASL